MLSTRHYVTVAYLAVLAMTTGQALAQRPQYSSKEEFKACLDQEDKIAEAKSNLFRRVREHEADLKAKQDESRAHADSQANLNTSDEQAVDRFNLKVKELNDRADAINQRGESLMKEQQSHNALVASHNKRCAGMVVRMTDREAVLKERQAQSKSK
jgi:hypothetical protein